MNEGVWRREGKRSQPGRATGVLRRRGSLDCEPLWWNRSSGSTWSAMLFMPVRALALSRTEAASSSPRAHQRALARRLATSGRRLGLRAFAGAAEASISRLAGLGRSGPRSRLPASGLTLGRAPSTCFAFAWPHVTAPTRYSDQRQAPSINHHVYERRVVLLAQVCGVARHGLSILFSLL